MFRVQLILRKRVHYCALVSRPIHPFAIGVLLLERESQVGLGGLGHLALQFATKMGADVTVVTTSPDKVEDARRFGAKDVLINKDGADFSKYKRAFDFILDTIPYQNDLDRFLPILTRDATLCRVGVGNSQRQMS